MKLLFKTNKLLLKVTMNLLLNMDHTSREVQAPAVPRRGGGGAAGCYIGEENGPNHRYCAGEEGGVTPPDAAPGKEVGAASSDAAP
jgi:hypothetical protein